MGRTLRYSGESYQRRAASALGNSITTRRFGFHLPSSAWWLLLWTMNLPPYCATLSAVGCL